MTATLADDLRADFLAACNDLTAAHLMKFHKDTPENRQAVADAEAGIDAVLDMWLETRAVVAG